MDPNSGQCIFCDKHGGLTGEHLWPQWMHEIIPRGGIHQQTHTRFVKGAFRFTIQPEPFFRRQPYRNRQLRIACASCNGGWMSEIETGAQGILRRLQVNPQHPISRSDQLSISRWATLRSIVNQYTIEDRVAIPLRDRLMLARGGNPSEEWRIWIGTNAASEWELRMAQHIAAAMEIPSDIRRLNLACTLIGFGKTFLYTQRSPKPIVDLNLSLYYRMCLAQIWPITSETLTPYDMAIDDPMANMISHALDKSMFSGYAPF